MKKILAFVLATIMVMSLVPASVFATVYHCPGLGEHNKENCDEVFVSKVDPTCEGVGYTTWECADCKAKFVDDFVAATGHNIPKEKDINDATHVPVADDCKTEKHEIRWVKCGNEGCTGINNVEGYTVTPCACDTCKASESKIYKLVAKNYNHDYKRDEDTIGCDAEWYCTKCEDGPKYQNADGEFVARPAHKWVYSETLVAPVLPTNEKHEMADGKALFVCANEGCNENKVVTILAECVGHKIDEKVSDAVAPNCVDNGKYAVYQCKKCHEKAYYTQTSDKKQGTLVDIKYVDGSENINPAKPGYHVIDTEAATSSRVPGSCEWKGVCTVCKKTDATMIEHVKLILAKEVPSTCGMQGYKAYTCANKCNGEGTAVIVYDEEWTKLDHELVEKDIAATCETPSYKITYCKTPGCNYGLKETGTGIKVYDEKDDEIKEVFTITVDEEDGDATYPIVKVLVGSKVASAHKPVNQYFTDYESCYVGTKLYYKVCAICGDDLGDGKIYTETATGHDFYLSKVWNTPYAENVVSQNYALTCRNCPVVVETVGNNAEAEFVADGVTYKRTELEVDLVFDTEEEAKFYHGELMLVITRTVEDEVETLEKDYKDNDKAAGKITAVVGATNNVAATCQSKGWAEYTCSNDNCKLNFFVRTEEIDHYYPGTSNPDYYKPAKAPTCKENGNIRYYICKDCGDYFTYAYPNGPTSETQVELAPADVVLKKHTQHADVYNDAPDGYQIDCNDDFVLVNGEKVPYWTCPANCTTVPTENPLGLHKDPVYLDANGNVISGFKTKKDCPKHTPITAAQAANCELPGNASAEWCEVCGKLWVNYSSTNKTPVKDNVIEVEKVTEEIVIDGKVVRTIVSKLILTIEGKEETEEIVLKTNKLVHNLEVIDSHIEHTLDCSAVDALYVLRECTLCKHSVIKAIDEIDDESADFVIEHPHENEAGNILVDDCGNHIYEARDCIICDKEIKIQAHESGSETLVVVNVPGTCKEAGSVYNYCTACDYAKFVKYDAIDADTYHKDTKKLEEVKATYGTPGYWYCPLCDYKTEPVDAKENGFDVILSTSVNDFADLTSATHGSEIKLTVSLKSYNSVKVWGFNFPITYDKDILEVTDITVNSTSFEKPLVNDVKTYVEHEATDEKDAWTEEIVHGKINIAAVSGMEGTVITDETFVTITFKTKYYTGTDAADKYKAGYQFTAGTVNAIDDLGATNTIGTETIADEAIKFVEFCKNDTSKDWNISDAYYMYQIIMLDDVDYDVAFDINADGVIDAEELANFYDLLIGATTIEKLIGQN